MHQFAKRDLGRGPPTLRVGVEQRQVFVKRAHVELTAADLVSQPLQHGLRGRVRVNIDKAGQDREAASIYLDRISVVGGPNRADRGDRIAFNH